MPEEEVNATDPVETQPTDTPVDPPVSGEGAGDSAAAPSPEGDAGTEESSDDEAPAALSEDRKVAAQQCSAGNAQAKEARKRKVRGY